MQLAAKPKSPIVSALRGREHIQYDNPSGEDYCFSNSALAFVELEMMAAGILGQETELVNSDFVAVARSAGMFGVRVEDPADLKKAVTETNRARARTVGFGSEKGIPIPRCDFVPTVWWPDICVLEHEHEHESAD